jgi:2-keto-4-pentenoate hydratase/2-oxohepta-3-ene-1,7-dioic acid hydratase in catechol pathway
MIDGSLVDLPTVAEQENVAFPQTLLEMIQAGADALEESRRLTTLGDDQARLTLDTVTLLAPITRPTKNVFCVGRNYSEHVAEGFRAAGKEVALPDFPQFFTKAPTAIASPEGEFALDPALTQKLDYEAELAVVIGTGGRGIGRAAAMDHVFGYSVFNDITARDLQRRHEQWFKGKSLDGSGPMGPCLVTADEIADLEGLEISARVNGEQRQHARVAQMIFDIPEIIAQLSAGMTLEAGDIIATGTPSGVGYAMDPPQFLAVGDLVECAISGIGTISTRIVEGGAQ